MIVPKMLFFRWALFIVDLAKILQVFFLENTLFRRKSNKAIVDNEVRQRLGDLTLCLNRNLGLLQ